MLYHVILELKENPVTKLAKKLVIHAHNCAGQNKNPFMLWFLSWLVCDDIFEEFELKFLIAGHTKIVCDGAFWLVKKEFQRTEVLVLEQMNDVIRANASNTDCVL